MIPIKDDVESQSFPVVNLLLIVANIGFFLYEIMQGESFVKTWAVVPHRFVNHHDLAQFATIFSSMFMHAGITHLAGNMWFLWIFGDNVEDNMGHLEYLMFYLLCGIAADVAQILSDPLSAVATVGASGAIAGVMGAYLLLYPSARIRMWLDEVVFFSFYWPAWLVIGEWWIMQWLMGMVIHESNDHVAYFAHLGGFAAGMVLIMFFARRDRQPAYEMDYQYR